MGRRRRPSRASRSRPAAVVATGTDRGNEVLAHAAARLDLPMVANCIEFAGRRHVRRDRVCAGVARCSRRPRVDAEPRAGHRRPPRRRRHGRPIRPARPNRARSNPTLDPSLARSVVADRVERVAGVTLSTAPVVVGGGRGVGSADGFAPLQELADLLGGVVGCSRAVTNNGWRNHTDQVGQTGTRIAPDIYFACGISGAIQHWVGAMASKNILAINTDPEANMVTKAGYAVIGDLHQVVPAISAEIRRRRGIS